MQQPQELKFLKTWYYQVLVRLQLLMEIRSAEKMLETISSFKEAVSARTELKLPWNSYKN
uniref:Alternative protein NAE1 n=1 Tax=Homo sapiens TaxID=9606 RepID=L8E934_HUMAN|nr:alternative protein NAE1 [Homo sapiens]